MVQCIGESLLMPFMCFSSGGSLHCKRTHVCVVTTVYVGEGGGGGAAMREGDT